MRIIVFLLGVLTNPIVMACGYCIEDRIAAVYDHAVVVRALGTGHHIAFLAIEGATVTDQARLHSVRRTVGAVAGVDRASIRLSAEGAALSFAFNPARSSLDSILKKANEQLAAQGLELAVLRVDKNPDGRKQ